MAEYWSIEVFHGDSPATAWRHAYGTALIESGVSHGATDWTWIENQWGVVLELCFDDEEQWDRFRALPAVRAALDAVPDPVNGLLVYRGRGGAAGASSPRRPRPVPSAGAVALDEVAREVVLDITRDTPPGAGGDLAAAR
jgi:hypothetical protein